MTNDGWLKMSENPMGPLPPEDEGEAVVDVTSLEAIRELRRLIAAAPVPLVDDATWAAMITRATAEPGTPDGDQESTGRDRSQADG